MLLFLVCIRKVHNTEREPKKQETCCQTENYQVCIDLFLSSCICIDLFCLHVYVLIYICLHVYVLIYFCLHVYVLIYFVFMCMY